MVARNESSRCWRFDLALMNLPLRVTLFLIDCHGVPEKTHTWSYQLGQQWSTIWQRNGAWFTPILPQRPFIASSSPCPIQLFSERLVVSLRKTRNCSYDHPSSHRWFNSKTDLKEPTKSSLVNIGYLPSSWSIPSSWEYPIYPILIYQQDRCRYLIYPILMVNPKIPHKKTA